MKIKKLTLSVFAFLGVTVCDLRQPADRHETNLESRMYQFFWPNYFANFLPIFFESVLSYESTNSEDAVHGARLSLVQGRGLFKDVKSW